MHPRASTYVHPEGTPRVTNETGNSLHGTITRAGCDELIIESSCMQREDGAFIHSFYLLPLDVTLPSRGRGREDGNISSLLLLEPVEEEATRAEDRSISKSERCIKSV